MFCWQCEWTKNGTGCQSLGNCGKTPQVAALSDLLLFTVKRLGGAAHLARTIGSVSEPIIRQVDRFLVKGLYATLSNVNFDPEKLSNLIDEAEDLRENLTKNPALSDLSTQPLMKGLSLLERIELGAKYPVNDLASLPLLSLRETTLYGLKGLAAYAYHAAKLGREDPGLYALVEHTLAKSLDPTLTTVDDWLKQALAVGEKNLLALELLDAAHTDTFGIPRPTSVKLGGLQGPAILVSGHDLKDLSQLIDQAKKLGVLVYTHGEALPAHGYPALKPGLAGHWGTGWQNQTKELAAFPGPIVFTTNCLQKPAESYRERVFVLSPVGWPGVKTIEDGQHLDFGAALKMALELGGFTQDQPQGEVTVGWGWSAVLSAAGQIKELVTSGRLRRFLLVGGCDGHGQGRAYYRDLVAQAPSDTVILTLGCGKFRFFDQKLGDLDGVPRLLDLGQCNDAFSAIKIALALAEVFNTPVNDLPLSLILSWHEQKACAILLSLLSLGIKNIRLGPTLPAFLHPDILNALVTGYDLKPTTTPEADLKAILV
ncbi:MAG: hydroxylamine reductase [Deltaproteobacteria bacterium]|jgi:hydroxylamine reductase|nr:hydroxylamine reductase [Deltaproteobacteria bacterium]